MIRWSHYCLMLLLYLISGEALPGQDNRQISRLAMKQFEEVREHFNRMDWDKALAGAERLTKKFPMWADAWLIKAAIHEETGSTGGELESLKSVIRIDPASYPKCYFRIAAIEFRSGNYDIAFVHLNSFKSLAGESANLSAGVVDLTKSIDFARKEIQKEAASFPAKLGNLINTTADEYFPSLTVDGKKLFFTRQEWIPAIHGKTPGQEDLYSILFDSGSEGVPAALPKPVNTPGNEGTQCISQDGRIMLFTACNRPDSKGGCDLYLTRLSDSQWEVPLNLGYPVNSRYWESTPFLAADGITLYFSSNRLGGMGGMDLWSVTRKADGSWTDPENLGAEVNTIANELSPFMLPDSRNLYFASNGHTGMGGYDLYRSVLSDSSGWMTPVNLGYPVNTYHDEDAITFPGVARFAIFASNRDSLTGKDLYLVNLPVEVSPPRSVIVRGTVLDAVSLEPLGTVIEISATAEKGLSRVESDAITGKFFLGLPLSNLYRVSASRPGYLFYSDQILADSIGNQVEINLEILLHPVRPGASVVLKNVFFTTDSYELLSQSEGELDELVRLIRENPGITIEIGGHTDSTGSEEYNLDLSRKRAGSVRDYLLEREISPQQILIQGYGHSEPVASNETPEGRSLNRRTEIKIIGTR